MSQGGDKQALDLGVRPRPRAELPSESYEDETIVVEPEASVMHALTGVGPFLWERMDGETSLEELAEALCRRYEVDLATARRDVREFAGQLLEGGLIELDPQG